MANDTSNSYDFNLSLQDCVLESFDRIGFRPTMLTREHMISARRSLNLELQSWSNMGPNLWAIDLQTIPLVQGVLTYTLPSNTVSILDAYRETYSLPTTVSLVPSLSTILGSKTVTVNQTANGLAQDNWINFQIQVAVGGIVLYGPYQVSGIVGADTYTVQATDAATSTVSNTGVVPQFTSVDTSQVITVTLPNHGLTAGQNFNIYSPTYVGGLSLYGPYPATSIIDANNFTIQSPTPATSNDAQFENTGQVIIQTQQNGQEPIDSIMTPISRSEYASYPNKFIQGTPTVYWFDRLSPIPTVTIWQAPDNNGPYAFKYYRMRRVQDASPSMGQTADIPYLFLDALCAGLAARLARKYAPAMFNDLKMEAADVLDKAMVENREYVDIMISPMLESYWRV